MHRNVVQTVQAQLTLIASMAPESGAWPIIAKQMEIASSNMKSSGKKKAQ